jgi:streptogramin lyase
MARTQYSLAILLGLIMLSGCGGGGGGGSLPAVHASGQPGSALSVDGFTATFTEYPLPNGATHPQNMTVGPDGEVWFPVNNGVDRISENGTISGFSDPSQPDYFAGITSQNGKVWFGDGVALAATNVASLTPGGVFADIPFGNATNTNEPGSFTSAGGVVYVGYSGNFFSGIDYVPFGSSTIASLGLSDTTGDAIAGMTVASNHDLYAVSPWTIAPLQDSLIRCPLDGSACTIYILDTLPAPLTGVQDVVEGADGNLWITALTANAILKVSLNGTVLATYPLPTQNSAPLEIISAPDGTLWFTEEGANKLGRITTSGVLTEYTIPTANSAPLGITTCPTQCTDAHGRIWFTEYTTNKIGKLQY